MYLKIILLFCMLQACTRADDIPQMEVLFYSSDPDLGLPLDDFSASSPAEWLGHQQQLAKYQSREKVDVAYKKGFPSAKDFYFNFVERKNPVIFSHAIDNKDYEFLTFGKLNSSGRTALSLVEISSFTSKEKETRTLQDFAKNLISKPFYVSGNLHDNLKRLFQLPACLQCSYLVDLLLETSHVLMGHAFPLPLKQTPNEVLHCQIDGSKEILLIDPKESPEVESLLDIDTPPYGRASLLNTLSVDYEKYPSLAKIKKFKIALLGPGITLKKGCISL